MSEFVYLFRASEAERREAMGTPERAQRSMQVWMAWIRDLEAKGHLKDRGRPLERGGKVVRGKKEVFEAFWPHAVDDSPTAPDPHGGRRTPEVRAMGVWINEATKVVFSRTRKDVTWRNSRLLPELDPREIEAMKRQPGSDILVFGSGS